MSGFYSLLFALLVWSEWPVVKSVTLSAVKKAGAPKTAVEPDSVLDLVEIVSGRHKDAVAVATFTNSISENG